jgi:hypothetical protein
MYTGSIYRGFEESVFQLRRGGFIRTDPETTMRMLRRRDEFKGDETNYRFWFIAEEEDMTNFNIPLTIPAFDTLPNLQQPTQVVGVSPVQIEPDNFQLFEMVFGIDGLAIIHMLLEGKTRWEPDEREFDIQGDVGVAYVSSRDSPVHSPHPKTRTYLVEKTLPKFEVINKYPFRISSVLVPYTKKFNVTLVEDPNLIERLNTGRTKWTPISVQEFVQ